MTFFLWYVSSNKIQVVFTETASVATTVARALDVSSRACPVDTDVGTKKAKATVAVESLYGPRVQGVVTNKNHFGGRSLQICLNKYQHCWDLIFL